MENNPPKENEYINKILEFMEAFLNCSLRVPSNKWSRMMSSDTQKHLVHAFVTMNQPQVFMHSRSENLKKSRPKNS